MREESGSEALVSVPRRVVTVYLPIAVFLVVLLFPFYWMTLTTFKSRAELYDFEHFNPLWVIHPTLEHIPKLPFETSYPEWLWNTMLLTAVAPPVSPVCAAAAAYATARVRLPRGRARPRAGGRGP